MFIRITACLLADPLDGPFAPGCFGHFIASVPAPAATGWSESCRVGSSPHWSSAPFHGALRRALRSPTTLNDPVVHRHTVELTGLEPGTTYAYRVGDGSARRWGNLVEFTTAPADPKSLAFVYMGDAQNGLDAWGRLLHRAFRARPDAAFYLIAGDLVDRGLARDDWDSFFKHAAGVFDRRPLVPVLGNHECEGGRPDLYLAQFALPPNGPAGIEPERAYTLRWGEALVVVLDSNLSPQRQSAWLEEQLRNASARWKIVAYHHPAFSSAPRRDNKAIPEVWTPLFDRYGVDLVLQGHDHAYLRTRPLRGGVPTANGAAGTTYVVAVSGTKFYTQVDRPETARGFTRVSTWQVLDLEIQDHSLLYRAYDRYGRLRDAFAIDKGAAALVAPGSGPALPLGPGTPRGGAR